MAFIEGHEDKSRCRVPHHATETIDGVRLQELFREEYVVTDRLRQPARPREGLRVSTGFLRSKIQRLAQLLTHAHTHSHTGVRTRV